MTDPVAGAKNTIANILHELHIGHIVFVDDLFELTHSAEAAVGWFDEALARLPGETAALLPSINFLIPERGWVEEFRESWDELGKEGREDVIARLSEILNRDISQDREFAVGLQALFPRNYRPNELAPSAWEEQRERILAAASPESRVLCLFDQDLSHAAGFTAEGTRSGIGLLTDVVEQYPAETVICGLISHTFTPAGEMAVWRRFATDHDLVLGRFLPISKQRLREPLSFAAAMMKTTLNLYCERMKEDAIDVLKSASRDAENDLRAVDVYDFDQMVLRSSLKEGVSEIETLLRIYQIFHQDRVKRAFLDPERASQFKATVGRARPLSRIGESLRDNRPDNRWELRHREMFEDDGLVNAFHAPLHNGDLFCLNGEAEPSLILVAQPCDLMVRSSGRRGEHGEDKVVDLIPVRSASQEALKHRTPNLSLRALLPFLYRGTDDVGVVEFARAHVVRLDVLDLVVLDREGRAVIDLDAWDPEPPPQFHRAWCERRNLLAERFRDRAAAIERVLPVVERVDEEETRTALLAAVMPTVTLSSLPLRVPCYDGGRFDFGIRRVGRLREPWADRMLANYMRYRARAAEQHDFTA